MGLGGDGGPILSSSWLVSDRLGAAGKVGIGRQAQGPGVKPRASPVTPTIAKFAAALCPLRGHPCCPLEVLLPGAGSCCHLEVTLFCPEERALPGGGPLSLVLSGTCGGVSSPALPFCVWWGRDLLVAAGPTVSHLHSSCRLGRRGSGPACPTTALGPHSCSSCCAAATASTSAPSEA